MATIEDMKKKKSQINEIIENINNNDLSAFNKNFQELKEKFPNDKELVYQEIYGKEGVKSIYQSAIVGDNNEIFKEVSKNAKDIDKNTLINTEELFKVVENNDEKKLEVLLSRNIDPYCLNENGDYVLEKAVEKNNIGSFSTILDSMRKQPESYELFSEEILNKCSEVASKLNTSLLNEDKKEEYSFMLNLLEANGADMVLNNDRGNSITLVNMITYSNEEGINYLMGNKKDLINLDNPNYINFSMEKVFESAYFQDSPIKGLDKDILDNLMENNFKVELTPKSIEKLTNTIKSEEVRELTKDLIKNGFDIQSHDNAFANNLIQTSGTVDILKDFIKNEGIGSKNHDKLIETAIERNHSDIAKEVIKNANQLEDPVKYFSKATEKSMNNVEFDEVMNTIIDKTEKKGKLLNDSLEKMVNKTPESQKVLTNYDFKINDNVKELYKEKNQDLSNIVSKKELNNKLTNNLEERKKDRGQGFKI